MHDYKTAWLMGLNGEMVSGLGAESGWEAESRATSQQRLR